MRNTKYIIVILCIALFIGSASALSNQVCLRDACLSVEIADSEPKRIKGLSGRLSLADRNGMLFIFPEEDILKFWMKGTFIPLDMIWLDRSQKVVYYIEEAPAEKEGKFLTFTPSSKARFVVETNAGFIRENKIRIGDQAEFKGPYFLFSREQEEDDLGEKQ